ncbi:SPOSA6832_00964 [Sporobolomyces salmonicolor]|uniref:Transcription initiation factor TFIID subunit 13 n=1 Tax=Sporidiobolus salmonicolor TaxID=5005 RepID=A0A0D6EHS0_SPOSA|nr:SPOSA6832_00964 [Sporobolomyces salmonicolor]
MAQPAPQLKAQPQRRLIKKGLFAKDLGPMMYGFGDDNPAPDTINVMEELVIEHITDVCMQAHRISTNRGKIKVDDFRFALRRDPKKLARIEELLFMQEEIARARRGDNLMDYAEPEDVQAAAGKKGPAGGAAAGSGTGGASAAGAFAVAGAGAEGKSKGKGKSKATG